MQYSMFLQCSLLSPSRSPHPSCDFTKWWKAYRQTMQADCHLFTGELDHMTLWRRTYSIYLYIWRYIDDRCHSCKTLRSRRGSPRTSCYEALKPPLPRTQAPFRVQTCTELSLVFLNAPTPLTSPSG